MCFLCGLVFIRSVKSVGLFPSANVCLWATDQPLQPTALIPPPILKNRKIFSSRRYSAGDELLWVKLNGPLAVCAFSSRLFHERHPLSAACVRVQRELSTRESFRMTFDWSHGKWKRISLPPMLVFIADDLFWSHWILMRRGAFALSTERVIGTTSLSRTTLNSRLSVRSGLGSQTLKFRFRFQKFF